MPTRATGCARSLPAPAAATQAGDSQLCNQHPPPKIPPGTYDTGDGFFKADAGVVCSYEGEDLRTADKEEEE